MAILVFFFFFPFGSSKFLRTKHEQSCTKCQLPYCDSEGIFFLSLVWGDLKEISLNSSSLQSLGSLVSPLTFFLNIHFSKCACSWNRYLGEAVELGVSHPQLLSLNSLNCSILFILLILPAGCPQLHRRLDYFAFLWLISTQSIHFLSFLTFGYLSLQSWSSFFYTTDLQWFQVIPGLNQNARRDVWLSEWDPR